MSDTSDAPLSLMRIPRAIAVRTLAQALRHRIILVALPPESASEGVGKLAAAPVAAFYIQGHDDPVYVLRPRDGWDAQTLAWFVNDLGHAVVIAQVDMSVSPQVGVQALDDALELLKPWTVRTPKADLSFMLVARPGEQIAMPRLLVDAIDALDPVYAARMREAAVATVGTEKENKS